VARTGRSAGGFTAGGTVADGDAGTDAGAETLGCAKTARSGSLPLASATADTTATIRTAAEAGRRNGRIRLIGISPG
jgi:hypothetical protein